MPWGTSNPNTMKQKNTNTDIYKDAKLPKSCRENPFSVPDGYFETSASCITSNIAIDRKASSSDRPFSVPDNYFEQLTSVISTKISEQYLRDAVEETGFDLPQGYLEESARQIQSRIRLESVQPSEQNAFSIPEPSQQTYFESLSARIMDKVQQEQPLEKATPVVQIPSRASQKGGLRWSRYAAAACILAVMSIGVYFGLDATKSSVESETIIVNKLAATAADIDQEVHLKEISDEELFEYLAQSTDANDLYYFSEYMYTEDDASAMNELEDNELIEYINQVM